MIGWLQALHNHMFRPPLPDRTVQAIDGLGFGIVDKLFIDFGPSSDASSSSALQSFSNYGPAGGSNADQSRTEPQNDPGHAQVASTDPGGDQSISANQAVSYYLLWNRDPLDFQPVLQLQQGQTTARPAEAIYRHPLTDMHQKATSEENVQRDYREGGPAVKGAGDKAPDTHLVTDAENARHNRAEPSTSSVTDATSGSDDSMSQHALPSWAHGAYTVRFAGSEFVQGPSGRDATAANRCGVVWITGEDARGMEADSDKGIHDSLAAILQQFPALRLPDQFTVHRSNWGADPLFRGSYSYGSAAATGTECDALCEPVVAQTASGSMLRVLFAGEACHSKFFGCTHGAYLTGQLQAQRLLSSWSASLA